MSYQGHIQNGLVVFDEPVSLAEGTRVPVAPISPPATDFWQTYSLEELARRQGVVLPEGEEYLGGWPEDELNDGFEDAVVHWRETELEQRR
jgi:hypothetical protein